MSAIADNNDGPIEVVKVLFTLFPGYNTLDVAGPLEVLNRALHDSKNKCKSSIPLLALLQHQLAPTCYYLSHLLRSISSTDTCQSQQGF